MIFQVYGSLKPEQPRHSLLLKKPWTDPASVHVVTTWGLLMFLFVTNLKVIDGGYKPISSP